MNVDGHLCGKTFDGYSPFLFMRINVMLLRNKLNGVNDVNADVLECELYELLNTRGQWWDR